MRSGLFSALAIIGALAPFPPPMPAPGPLAWFDRRESRSVPGVRHWRKTNPPPIPTTERPTDPRGAARWEAAQTKRARRAERRRRNRPVGLVIGFGERIDGDFVIEFSRPAHLPKLPVAAWADLHELVEIVANDLSPTQVLPFHEDHPKEASWMCQISLHNDPQATALTTTTSLSVFGGSRDTIPFVTLIRRFLDRLKAEPDFEGPCPLTGAFSMSAVP